MKVIVSVTEKSSQHLWLYLARVLIWCLNPTLYSQGNIVYKEIDNPCWSVRALVQQYEGQRDEPDEESETRPPRYEIIWNAST